MLLRAHLQREEASALDGHMPGAHTMADVLSGLLTTEGAEDISIWPSTATQGPGQQGLQDFKI